MMDAYTQTDSETIDHENQIGLNYLIRNRCSTELITNALNENSVRLNYRNNDGDTALHLAVEACNENIVDLLVRKGAPVDIKNYFNKTPIDIMHDKWKNSSNFSDSDRAKWKAIQISLEGESSSNESMELDENPANSPKRPASPSNDSTPRPKKRITHPAGGIKTSLNGVVFQLKLLMLFACHAIERSSEPFLMASEMVAAEKFDDIVFHMNHKTRYLQAKHKLDCVKDKITSASLLSTSDKEAFSLQKYFISFCKIKRNEEWFGKSDLCEFIIITNTYPDLTETDRTIKHRDSNASIRWRKISKKDLSDDDREILYIDKFEAEKYKLDATDELREILITSLLNGVLGMKLIKNLVAIRDTLKAIKTVQFKASIIEAKRSVEQINEKCSVNHIKFQCEKVLQLEGKVLEGESNKIHMDSLKKAKQEVSKPLKNRKFELKRKFLNIAKEVSELAMKELNDSETLLAKTKDSKSNEFKMLEEDKTKMLKAEKELNEARKGIQESKNLESLKQQSKNSIIKNYVSQKFYDDDLRKVDSEDKLEKVKNKMDGKLEQIISQISIIHVWFNEFDSLFNEFFEKLYFVTNYPDKEKLDEYINDELRDSFNLLNSDLLMAALEVKMLNFLKYYKNGRAEFLTLDDIKTFFDTLKQKLTGIMASGLHTLHVNVLKNYGIRFKKNPEKLQAFFNKSNDQMQVFHFCTTTSRLSAIKVLRTIEACPLFRQPDSYIFTNLHTLLVGEVGSTYTLMQPQEIILNAFRAPKSHFLLVIECHDEADGENQNRLDLNKLYESLYDILSENSRKKLIFIAKSQLSFGRLKINHFQEDKILFKDLDDVSKTKVLKKNVNFQQKKNYIELIELIDENSANCVFDQMILEEFIDSDQKPFRIGDDKAFLSIDYVKNFYINRKFLRNDTSQDEDDFCKAESFENKVIIVANEAGMGKSTVLTSIAEKMKNTLSNLWIVRVNLNDYADRRKPQSLFKIKFDENEVNSAIKFLTKMVIVSYPKKNPANRFQQNLFKLGLENNSLHNETGGRKPKIVIIFDGFDEVSRSLKTNVTVLIKALKMSQVTQIWVSTRLHKKPHLEKALVSNAYELDPLSELNQIELASKFWKWKLKFAKTLSEKKHVLKSFKEILEYLLDIKLPETDYATQLRESILEIRKKFPLKNRSKKKALIEDIDCLDFSEYIKKLKDHWESVEDKDFHFTENPLHLRMLTEVIYEKKFELLENFGLFDLFDAFVEIKFGIYYKNKGNARGNETIEELCNRDTDNLRKIHCALAVKKLTNDNQYETLPNLHFECKDKQQFDRIGFLKLDEEKDTLEFMHRSYAEFFCSIYLIDNLENEQVQKLAKKLVPNQDSSKEDDYKLLRQFILKNTNKNELKKKVFFL